MMYADLCATSDVFIDGYYTKVIIIGAKYGEMNLMKQAHFQSHDSSLAP